MFRGVSPTTMILTFGYEGEIILTRRLYHASPSAYFGVLREYAGANDQVMVVGHNPGMEELLEDLASVYERMPTAALAKVELPIDTWEELGTDVLGRLVGIWRPRELPDPRIG